MRQHYIEIFIASVFLFFFIIYFLEFFSLNEYVIIRNPISYKESFVNLEPSDINASYSLLDGVLSLKEEQKYGKLNSQTCYDSSFTTRLERTGNYLQRTNNYRHKDPDSCTSPNQEFVTSFYKVEPLD
jgi:hypothetical protein